jgi:hypothetical protein
LQHSSTHTHKKLERYQYTFFLFFPLNFNAIYLFNKRKKMQDLIDFKKVKCASFFLCFSLIYYVCLESGGGEAGFELIIYESYNKYCDFLELNVYLYIFFVNINNNQFAIDLEQKMKSCNIFYLLLFFCYYATRI